MEIVIELLFGVIGEILLQVFAELLVELGFHGLANTVKARKERNAYLAFIGYCILGFLTGLLSLAIFPDLFITHNDYALLNLVITPVVAGIAMSMTGKWRSKKGKDLIRLDTFLYGFAFALCMALTRYGFGDISA